VSGTDIVRCLAFRFQAFGRPVKNSKKFEEGVFSDLRNLKAGTDASLEEPKSAFLDFLYKNSCIRTQKKQKVFYWYSVPHDRLFLDALERDLKREKIGQETTTAAESEPALSFEFDASVSLFEQLTKSQQPNSSSLHQLSLTQSPYDGNRQAYSQSVSPVVRAADSMPPPQTVSQAIHNVAEDNLNDMSSYSQMTMPISAAQQLVKPTTNREKQYSGQMSYDRNGIPLERITNRHSSMPAFMEYSPAPSFVSSQSHYDEYSNRGISYEPVTPPQQALQYVSEPAYIANEDTGLYTAIPELHDHYANMMQLPPSNLFGPQYNAMSRPYPVNTIYSHIEGSPTYKQRRRRSSLNSGYNAAVVPALTSVPSCLLRAVHSVRRPSDLRRSVSASIMPMTRHHVERSASGPADTYSDLAYRGTPEVPQTYHHMTAPIPPHPYLHTAYTTPEISRHCTPMSTIEDQHSQQFQQSLSLKQQNYAGIVSDRFEGDMSHPAPGVFRRARSATIATDVSPYPQKSHSCPIPACGRLFKRIEHLKRHVRTHTQERPHVCADCAKAFSRSDNRAQHRRAHTTEGEETEEEGSSGIFDDEELDNEVEQFPSPEESDQGLAPHSFIQGSMQLHHSMPVMSAYSAPMGMNMGRPAPATIAAQGY